VSSGAQPAHTSLGPGGEFDLVRTLIERWGAQAEGIGDDAAVVDVPAGERLVVSVDASVDRVHFRRDWMSPSEIGYRAATAALSDLAAMAATPRGLLVTLVVPEDARSLLAALADGIGGAARQVGIPIVGGDLSRGEELSITCTVLGSSASPARRSAVRPGDILYVTGLLGGPSAALRAYREGQVPEPAWRERFLRPKARLAEARWLAQHGVQAMIDISDGLASELQHLAAASGVALRLDVERVPTLRGCTLADATRGGEEYELLLASPHPLNADDFARTFALPLSEIGMARPAAAPEVIAVRGSTGERVDLGRGHDHFSP
jgi:thiamine-monophosphate kinase